MKLFSRIIAAILCVVFISFCVILPSSAAEFVAGANSASTSYKNGPYYSNLLSVPITGDNRTDVVAVALSQIGYQESDSSSEYSGTVGGSEDFTEYNRNFGKYNDSDGYGYYWCASFVSFCLLQARCHKQTKLSDWCRGHLGDKNYIWKEVSCSQWATQLRSCEYFENSLRFGGDYAPIAADLVFFTQNGTSESHVGIVLYTDETYVYTVEGNTSSASGLDANGGGVYVKKHLLSASYIRGYGVLPYKTNNIVKNIDYSGKASTPGTYVCTTSKYIYKNHADTSYSYVLPAYSQFTVTEITSPTRFKATFKINGETITGYIDNNSSRIIQISSALAENRYNLSSEVWGYRGHSITSYFANGSALSSKPSSPQIYPKDELGIKGWIGFTREVDAIGYYYDNDISNVLWIQSCISKADDATLVVAGKNAVFFSLIAKIDLFNMGPHTINFAVRLKDGSISVLESIEFNFENPPDAPPQPELQSFTQSSVTLVTDPIYEYKINDGEWQSSGVFEGLSPNTEYYLYQRIKETAIHSPSPQSVARKVKLCDLSSNKLISLSADGYSLSPLFNANTLRYEIQVPHDVTSISISPQAASTSGVSIGSCSFGNSEILIIPITVSNGTSQCVYTVVAYRIPKTPDVPEILSYSADTVTLKKIDGYEYKVDAGEWQSSNIFKGLNPSYQYSFYQRIARSNEHVESYSSSALTVRIKSLVDANKLSSLYVENASLSPSFSPNVFEYSVSVPYSVTSLDVHASAEFGKTISVSNTTFTAPGAIVINVTVTDEFGVDTVYKIIATRLPDDSHEDNPDNETDPSDTENTDQNTDNKDTPSGKPSVMPDTQAESGCASSISTSTLLLSIVMTLGLGIIKKKKFEI